MKHMALILLGIVVLLIAGILVISTALPGNTPTPSRWQPHSLGTATLDPTITPGWWGDLPTPGLNAPTLTHTAESTDK